MGFTINEAVFQAAAAAATKTSAGQEIIRLIIEGYIETGVRPAGVTGKVVTKDQMRSAAEALKDMIISGASNLPESIQRDVKTIEVGDISNAGDGKYEVTLTFTGSLSRESLVPYMYDPVNDIIALFNNGYNAKNRVFGDWHNRWVGSKTNRAGTHFINAAVDAFNSTYGGQFYAHAEPGENYK